MKISYRGYLRPKVEAKILAEEIKMLEDVENVKIEEWFLPPSFDSKESIIILEVKSLDSFEKIKSIAKRKNIAEPVNTYPNALIEALWLNGIIPSSKMNSNNKSNEDVLYEEPPFKYAKLRLLSNNLRMLASYMKPNRCIIELWNGELIEGSIDSVFRELLKLRIHVIYTSLTEKCFLESNGLMFPSNIIWIDDTAVQVDHEGLILWSRLSYTPLRLLNYTTIGRILTTIEALEARTMKYLITGKHGRKEEWRNLRNLLRSDRGGVIMIPKPGLYWGVAQIDFNSLYPSIIAKYNISGETVALHCSDNKPAGSPHYICVHREGIVAKVVKKLIEYREKLRGSNERIHKQREKALKWILVSSFGYLGYRNSLFGSISANEAVTGIARHVLTNAKRMLEERGLKVIHAMIDSLFVKGNSEEALNIVIKTGFDAKIEANFIWLYIPKARHGFGTSNKYYGLLDNGSLKIKGIMAAKRSTPFFIRDIQLRAIMKLAEARTEAEMYAKIETVYRMFKEAEKEILEKKIESWKLVSFIESKREAKRRMPWIRALESSSIEERGTVMYIIDDKKRPKIYDGECEYDPSFYSSMLWRAYEELPQALNLKEKNNPYLLFT